MSVLALRLDTSLQQCTNEVLLVAIRRSLALCGSFPSLASLAFGGRLAATPQKEIRNDHRHRQVLQQRQGIWLHPA
jgi:hypothetical protein